jgi:outer membrane beta-barrel protein
VASHRLVIAAALAAAVGAIAIAPRAARAQEAEKREARPTSICIDQEIADRLAVKRKRRKVVDRLFVKQARHELSLVGGYYVSDLFSSTYALGGAYTFHMTENTAVEMNVAFTHANADVIRAIEDERMQVLDDDFATVKFFESLLLWSPVYGKLRFGGSIARFDIHLDGGVGVVDSPTSRGAAGVAGIGLKLFAGQALAFRLDARDHVFKQELLDESFIVNDLSLTLGLSVFLPFSN